MIERGGLEYHVAGFGLPRDPEADAWPPVPEDRWGLVLARLAGHRLTGLALAASEEGLLSLTQPELTELVAEHRNAMVHALALERRLLRVVGALEDAGVEVVVLKGPALAHVFYPDPSWRPFSDLDLLIRGTEWPRACKVVSELGFRRDLPEPRHGFDQRFGKGACFKDDDGDVEVDLHRTLALGPFGLWITPDELFDRTSTFVLGGRVLRRLDDTATLLHVCAHAALGWNKTLLWTLRDVAQVLSQGSVEWEAFADFATRWRLGVVIGHALRSTSSLLDYELPEKATVFASAEPTKQEVKLLEGYTSERRHFGAMHLSTMRAIPGLRSKAAYVYALLLPNRVFLNARAGNADASYLRRWLIPLDWLGSRRSKAPRSRRRMTERDQRRELMGER